jgi:hypothetical protein
MPHSSCVAIDSEMSGLPGMTCEKASTIVAASGAMTMIDQPLKASVDQRGQAEDDSKNTQELRGHVDSRQRLVLPHADGAWGARV